MAHTQTLIATLSLLISILIALALNESVYSNTDLNVPLNFAAYRGKSIVPFVQPFVVQPSDAPVAKPVPEQPIVPEQPSDVVYNLSDAPVAEVAPDQQKLPPSKPPMDCRLVWGGPTSKYFMRSYFNENDDISREFLYGGFSARGAAISAIVLSIGTFVLAVTVPELDLDMDAGKYVGKSWFHEGDTKKFVAGVFYRLMVAGIVLSLGILGATSVGALFLQGFVPSAGVDYDDTDDFSSRDVSECKDIDDSVVYRSDALKASVFLSGVSVIAVGFLAYAVKYDRKASEKKLEE